MMMMMMMMPFINNQVKINLKLLFIFIISLTNNVCFGITMPFIAETTTVTALNLNTSSSPSLPSSSSLSSLSLASTSSTTIISMTNETNSIEKKETEITDLMLPSSLRSIATIVCLIVLMIGIAGNILVPLVVCRTRGLCTNSTNVFLINLSIADLLVLIVCMPTVLIELHSRPEVWMLGEFMCKAVPFVELVVAHGSVLTILAISFERYYAICKPLKANYKCTNRRAVITICGLWSLALMATVPVLFGTELVKAIYIDGSVVTVCITKATSTWQRIYFLVSILLFFCLPLVILIVVYCIITRRLTSDDRRLLIASIHSSFTSSTGSSTTKQLRSGSLPFVPSSMMMENKEQTQHSLWNPAIFLFRGSACSTGSRSGSGSCPSQNPNQRRNSSVAQAASVARSRRQVIFMLAAVVICFFLCLLPFRLFTLWLLLVSEDDIRALSMERFYNLLYFCRVMIYVNSMLNPLLYAVVSSKFRLALVDTIIKLFSWQFYCYCNCCCCCCCFPETDPNSLNNFDNQSRLRHRKIINNRRRRFLLLRQSTTLTTTTTTASSSSLKNNSIRSTTTNCPPQSSRYSSLDSIRAPKVLANKSNGQQQQQQQTSFDSNQTSTNSELEVEPSPPRLNILYSSQHTAEYRRKAMMKRQARVAIIDEDCEESSAGKLCNDCMDECSESNECRQHSIVDKNDHHQTKNIISMDNIEQLLNDKVFNHESYV